MADQGTIVFDGLFNSGARMSHVRGVFPSRCVMRLVPQTGLKDKVGNLEIDYGGTAITFPQCAIREVTPTTATRLQGQRYEVVIEDRRWKWRYVPIDGHYNRRNPNGSVRSVGKKNARELATLLFTELGDPSADVTAVPTDTYPHVKWNGSRASLELAWLLDQHGLTVSYLTNDTFKVVPLHDDSGAELPDDGILSPPVLHDWKPSTIPDTVRVQGSPTIIQSGLTLTNTRFQPFAAWAISTDNWPEFMPQVANTNRSEAILSGLRWYKVTGGWDGDGVTVSDLRQLEILPHLVEEHNLNTPDEQIYMPPVIKGNFWMWDELGTITSNEVYTGGWKYHPNEQLIELDRPLFKISGSTISAPDLTLYTAYRVREADGSGYSVYTKDLAVTGAPAATEPRVLNHPELTKVKIVDSPWGKAASDNESALDTEADAYLQGVRDVYTHDKASAYWYSGFIDVDLDGAISQVTYSCGEYSPGGVAFTLVGRHTEPDVVARHRRLSHEMGLLMRGREHGSPAR